ncbi:MAG: hypothetical protein ACD_79C01054G0001 [uncultured bacterium]|nr:MAG: hypothetical protein ACD_79C01054G0001 [uncultured bacterium]
MKTVLIVDDEDKIRRTYSKLFTKNGFNVVEASKAYDAYKALLLKKIDLILLDINMPGVDGATLFNIIKLFPQTIKVIVSSVYPLDDQLNLIEGAHDYFDKSEGLSKLMSKVKSVMVN